MNGNAFYSNKGWAKKAMTLLVNKMAMFETRDRSVNDGMFGEYQLGLRFYVSGEGYRTVFPTGQSDLDEIDAIVL